MEHGDHGSVFIRQFHHSLVQSSLQLGQVRFPHRTARRRELEKFLVVLNAGIDIVEAKMKTPATFFKEIQCHVHRDRVDPSIKGRLAPKSDDNKSEIRRAGNATDGSIIFFKRGGANQLRRSRTETNQSKLPNAAMNAAT